MQDKVAKIETLQTKEEKKKLKEECIALTHEKIKIAEQLEEQLKNAISFVNTKIKTVHSKIKEKNDQHNKDKGEITKPTIKKYNKQEDKEKHFK